MVQYVGSSADNWWVGYMQEKKRRRWAVPPIYIFWLQRQPVCESLAAQIVTGVLDEEKRPERRRRSLQDGDSVWNQATFVFVQ